MENHGPRANFVSFALPIVLSDKRLTENSRATFKKARLWAAVSELRHRTLLIAMLVMSGCAGFASPSAAGTTGKLVFSPASANFGTVAVGTAKVLSVTITNAGTATVTFSGESLVANHYSVSGFRLPNSLAAGKTLTISVRFNPEAAGSVTGHIRFTSNASNGVVDYPLAGVGSSSGSSQSGQLTAIPTNANLSGVPVGTKNSQVIQLKNTGSSEVAISGITVSGSSEFAACKLTYPAKLAAGQSTNCTVEFTPTVTGSVFGGLIVSSNATDASTVVSLSGQGIAPTRTLTVTPTSLNFGNVTEGKSETLVVDLKNNGNSSVVVSGITTSSGALGTSGGVQGATIAPGQSAALNVHFSPKQGGALSGTVSVTTNATGSPIKIAVKGDGVSGAGHVVSLTWNASASSGVAGYNVYRAALPNGSYVKLTSSVITGTSFSDPIVVPGDTYSYKVTAVNTRGEESAPSAAVSAVIP